VQEVSVLSVASQVATSIAQHGDGKVPAAASKDRAESSPFAELLDSALATNDPAPPKTARYETADTRPAGAAHDNEAPQADDSSAKGAPAPSQQTEPGHNKPTLAQPTSGAEAKTDLTAGTRAVETEPETGTGVETVLTEPDTEIIDLAAVMNPIAGANAAETKAEPAGEKAKPAVAEPPAADTKVVTKPDPVVAAVALPAPGTAGDAAEPETPVHNRDSKPAPKPIAANTTEAAPTTSAAKSDEARVEPAVTERVPAPQKTATTDHAEAAPIKEDVEGANARSTDFTPAREPANAAPVDGQPSTDTKRAAEVRPATSELKPETAASVKPPDLPAFTQNLVQAAASTTAMPSIHHVMPQKDVTAPSSPVPIDGVAVEIASKALEGVNRFEIRLDPPELGRIEVRLDVDRNGEIASHVMADRQDTLDLLRRDAPQLERALNDAGLRTAGNGLQFSLRDHGQSHREQQPFANASRLVVSDENLAADSMPRHYYRPASLAGGLDIRV
jgi:chemotaxis protein MotD